MDEETAAQELQKLVGQRQEVSDGLLQIEAKDEQGRHDFGSERSRGPRRRKTKNAWRNEMWQVKPARWPCHPLRRSLQSQGTP
eukprot:3291564-Pyramimonas_sp.AAC.1